MSRFFITTIVKLADDLEKDLEQIQRTMRPGELPPPKEKVRLPVARTPNTDDPYGIGEQLEFGPPDRQFDPVFAEGCIALQEKFQQLEIFSRVAAATVGTRNEKLIYNFSSNTSLVNLFKAIKHCVGEIQELYEKLP